MCDVAERLDRRGYERGLAQGIEKGIEKGITQGIEKGITQGRKEGLELGIKQGLFNEKREFVIELYKQEVPLDIIVISARIDKKQIIDWLKEEGILKEQDKDDINTNTMNLF